MGATLTNTVTVGVDDGGDFDGDGDVDGGDGALPSCDTDSIRCCLERASANASWGEGPSDDRRYERSSEPPVTVYEIAPGPPPCQSDLECPVGKICDLGTCTSAVPCVGDEACRDDGSAGDFCVDEACRSIRCTEAVWETSSACPPGARCIDSRCAWTSADACTTPARSLVVSAIAGPTTPYGVAPLMEAVNWRAPLSSMVHFDGGGEAGTLVSVSAGSIGDESFETSGTETRRLVGRGLGAVRRWTAWNAESVETVELMDDQRTTRRFDNPLVDREIEAVVDVFLTHPDDAGLQALLVTFGEANGGHTVRLALSEGAGGDYALVDGVSWSTPGPDPVSQSAALNGGCGIRLSSADFRVHDLRLEDGDAWVHEPAFDGAPPPTLSDLRLNEPGTEDVGGALFGDLLVSVAVELGRFEVSHAYRVPTSAQYLVTLAGTPTGTRTPQHLVFDALGDGYFAARVDATTEPGCIQTIVGRGPVRDAVVGDFDGDGLDDVVARTEDGALWLWQQVEN